jgi:hypothetical protein
MVNVSNLISEEDYQLIFVSLLPIFHDSIIYTMLSSTYRRSPDHHSYPRSSYHSSLVLTRLNNSLDTTLS